MRALIVDDEQLARDRLKRLLAGGALTLIGEAANGTEALEKIETLQPDVVFLDIEMPELNGLEVARSLTGENNGPRIVFVTAFDEFALKAFEVNAVDYLVKPVQPDRLAKTLERLQVSSPRDYSRVLGDMPKEKVQRLALKVGSNFIVVDPEKTVAVLARDHYSALIVGEKEYLSDDSIDALVAKLGSSFMRIHRAGAINLSFLKELEREGDRKYVAVLTDGTRVPVSRERLEALQQKLGLA